MIKSILPARTIKVPYFVNEASGLYKANRRLSADQIVKAAKAIVAQRVNKGDGFFTNPDKIRALLALHLANYEHEVFICIFLDNQNQVISMEEMFTGTIDSASIYPREVVKRALALNAAAVVFAHNHPSGITQPSQTDKRITIKLIDSLSLVDIRVLDHFIIGGAESFSFAEHGLI